MWSVVNFFRFRFVTILDGFTLTAVDDLHLHFRLKWSMAFDDDFDNLLD